MQGVLHVVGHGGGDHPDGLPPFGAGEPFGEHLRRRVLGVVQPARPLRVEQCSREQHAGQWRGNPVDEDHRPTAGPSCDARRRNDVVQAREEQADHEPGDDQRNGAAGAAHFWSVPEEMSHPGATIVAGFWNRPDAL